MTPLQFQEADCRVTARFSSLCKQGADYRRLIFLCVISGLAINILIKDGLTNISKIMSGTVQFKIHHIYIYTDKHILKCKSFSGLCQNDTIYDSERQHNNSILLYTEITTAQI